MFEGLFEKEVRAIIMTFSRSDFSDWLMWTQGWKEWKPITSKTSFKPIHRSVSESIPDPESFEDALTRELKDVITTHRLDPFLSQKTKQISEDQADFIIRAHKRYNKKFIVKIECDNRIFKSESVNISAGGIQLKDPIPNWVVGYCVVRVIDPVSKKGVELTCSLVENQPPTERYRVVFANPDSNDDKMTEQLDAWLKAA